MHSKDPKACAAMLNENTVDTKSMYCYYMRTFGKCNPRGGVCKYSHVDQPGMLWAEKPQRVNGVFLAGNNLTYRVQVVPPRQELVAKRQRCFTQSWRNGESCLPGGPPMTNQQSSSEPISQLPKVQILEGGTPQKRDPGVTDPPSKSIPLHSGASRVPSAPLPPSDDDSGHIRPPQLPAPVLDMQCRVTRLLVRCRNFNKYLYEKKGGDTSWLVWNYGEDWFTDFMSSLTRAAEIMAEYGKACVMPYGGEVWDEWYAMAFSTPSDDFVKIVNLYKSWQVRRDA